VSELALAVFASETGTHLIRPPIGSRWAAHLRAFDAWAYEQRLAADGFRFLARSAPTFPPLLRVIHDPPPGLFLRGHADLELLSRPAVAIVGARACSGYGASAARTLARDVARAGLVVVSGLARGIDAEAHRGALEAGGHTIAVLGCGIDRDYPAAHAELARRIAAAGLIVAEYAPGVEPAPWRFPARNRIVAGLAAATAVVEARERSGALITADLALEEGREVFAVPGEITSGIARQGLREFAADSFGRDDRRARRQRDQLSETVPERCDADRIGEGNVKANAFPLRIMPAFLLNPAVPPEVRLVMAQVMGYPNRDPSLSQLEGDLPIERLSIIGAQNWAEDHGYVVWDRPEHPWDRLPNSQRFNRSTRATHVVAHIETALAEDQPYELAAAVMARIRASCGGKKNSVWHPLQALLYSHEQRERRAFHMPDKYVPWLIGLPSEKSAGNVRRDLRAGGIIKFDRREQGDVFTMPGATLLEPDASLLDPAETRGFRLLNVGGVNFTVYASSAERDQAAGWIATLGHDETLRLLADAGVENGARAHIGPILQLLRIASKSTVVSRSPTLSRSFGHLLLGQDEIKGRSASSPTRAARDLRRVEVEQGQDRSASLSEGEGSETTRAANPDASRPSELSSDLALDPSRAQRGSANLPTGLAKSPDGLMDRLREALAATFGEVAGSESQDYEEARTALVDWETRWGPFFSPRLEVIERAVLERLALLRRRAQPKRISAFTRFLRNPPQQLRWTLRASREDLRLGLETRLDTVSEARLLESAAAAPPSQTIFCSLPKLPLAA